MRISSAHYRFAAIDALRSFPQYRLESVLRSRPQILIPHQSPRAAVPAQQRIVVAGRANALGLFVAIHRFAKCVVGVERGVRRTLPQLRASGTLPDHARVVGAFIFALKTL